MKKTIQEQSEMVSKQSTVEENESDEPSWKKNVASLVGKNCRWSTIVPSKCNGINKENIVLHLCDTKGVANKQVKTPEEAQSFLKSDDILQIIIKYTNEQIMQKSATIRDMSYMKQPNMTEIKAIVGLL